MYILALSTPLEGEGYRLFINMHGYLPTGIYRFSKNEGGKLTSSMYQFLKCTACKILAYNEVLEYLGINVQHAYTIN